jgi:hypothetical protein
MQYITHLLLVVASHNVKGGSYAFALASPSHPQPIQKVISRRAIGRYKQYFIGDVSHTNNTNEVKRASFSSRDVLNHMQSVLRSTFLPTTNQVSSLRQSGYLSYILYDNLQDLTTALRSVLATQRILEGVGVGRSGATALSATLNFLLRDGCGMIASLLFTSVAASTFRRNIKRWKYFADIMVDIGITVEILAPSVLSTRFHAWFLPLLCLGNVCKALCGVAAGSTGGALQMFWAVKLTGSEEGISEVSAKGGAQRTVIGGIGLILAGLTARWLDNGSVTSAGIKLQKKKLWISLYCLLTALHLTFNWMSLKLVALDWLNGWRLHRLVDDFLSSIEARTKDATCTTPVETSKAEPIFFLPELKWKKRHVPKYPIRLGVSFNDLIDQSNASATSLLTSARESNNDNYILKVGHTGRQLEKHRCILVAFTSECSSKEKAKAYLHACLVGRALTSLSLANAQTKYNVSNEEDTVDQAEKTGSTEANAMWPVFERCAGEAGWKLDKTEVSTEGYEICFE